MPKDILGNELKVNNWIAVSFRRGNNSELRVGKFIGIGRRTLYEKEVQTMIVEWLVSSECRLPNKATAINSIGTKFIIIPSPI